MRNIITSVALVAVLAVGAIYVARHHQRTYWFEELVGREVTTETIRGFYGESIIDIFGPDRYCIIIEYNNDLWQFLRRKHGLVPITRKATVPFEYRDYLKSRRFGSPEVYGTSFTAEYDDGRTVTSENPFVWHNPDERVICIGAGYLKEVQKQNANVEVDSISKDANTRL